MKVAVKANLYLLDWPSIAAALTLLLLVALCAVPNWGRP